jgi:hypothetical protein
VRHDFNLTKAQRRIYTSNLRPLERLVALALLDHWSKKFPQPFASISRLQQWTGLSRHPVVAALRGLRERGAIVVTESKNGSKSTYDLTPLMHLPVHEKHRSEPETSAPDAPVKVDEPVHEKPTAGAPDAPQPVHVFSQTSINSAAIPPKEPHEGTNRRNHISRASARKGSQVPLLAGEGEPRQSDHQIVVDFYVVAYRSEHGEAPVFTSEEGSAVKRLLKKAGSAEKACEFIRRAFASFRKKTVTIQAIARDPSAFREDHRNRPVQAMPEGATFLDDAEQRAVGGAP